MKFPRLRIPVLLVLVFGSSIYFALIRATRKPEIVMWVGAQPIPMDGFEPTPANTQLTGANPP